jgi:hypothetical protein
MKIFFKNLIEPFKSIADQPYHFIAWLLIAYALGTAGFWLPLFLLYSKGLLTNQTYTAVLNAGNLASFSVVILADGVATLLFAKGTGSNTVAQGIRGIAGALAIILILIQVLVLSDAHNTSNSRHISSTIQISLAIIAMLIATYLYCFRFPVWEKGVGELKEEEDKEVSHLAEAANARSADDTGVKL